MIDVKFTITWKRRPSMGGSILIEHDPSSDSFGFKNLGDDEDRNKLIKKIGEQFQLGDEQCVELDAILIEEVGKRIRDDDDAGDDGSRPSRGELGVRLVRQEALAFFHDPDGEAYIDVMLAGRRETLEVRTRAFREWLDMRFFAEHEKPLGGAARTEVIDTIAAQAKYEGSTEQVYLRVANLGNEVWLDLGEPGFVEVTSDGWTTRTDCPVKFRRPSGFLSLPVPLSGGDVSALRSLINIEDRDFPLVVGCLVSWLADPGPHVVLVLQGGDGSGKTSLGRILRELVDPSSLVLRGQPKDQESLVIAARNAWLVGFDNFSHVPEWLSDSLCRLTHGVGFGTRTLFTNRDETIFHERRPSLLTGIPALASRPDLMSRAIVLHLPPIDDRDRREESDVTPTFEEARPRILGALLDGVAAGLRNRGETKLDPLPRMADFAQFVHAAESAFDWKAGTFVSAYAEARDALIGEELSQEPVIGAVLSILDMENLPKGLRDEGEDGGVVGSPTAWFDAVCYLTPERTQRSRRWPQDARALSNKLSRFANVLRREGVEVVRDRDRCRRSILIRRQR